MSWSSKLIPEGNITSDILPDNIINQFKLLLNELILQNKTENTLEKYDEIFLDLIGCLIYGKITSKGIFHLFNLCNLSTIELGQEILTDVVWYWGIQISHEAGSNDTKPTERWQRLCTFVKDLFIHKVVDIERLKKTLEFNLLAGSGLWQDEATLQKRLVKINTSLVYRQDKYNLLREETEGYSKLLTVLSSMPPPPEDPTNHITNVFSVIGYFDLDPNRVLDLIIDAMENQIWNTSFIPLLKHFRGSSVVHILGFKFTQYSTPSTTTITSSSSSTSESSTTNVGENQSIETNSTNSSAPQSLYALTAILLSAELIRLDQILPYLTPNFEDFKTLLASKYSKLRDEINAYGVVNLTKKSNPNESSNKGSTTPSSIFNISESLSNKSSTSTYADGYQLIGLIAASLTIRNWNLAKELIQLFKFRTEYDPLDFEAPRNSLISLILWKIDKLYQPIGFENFNLAGPPRKSKKDPSSLFIPNLNRIETFFNNNTIEHGLDIGIGGLIDNDGDNNNNNISNDNNNDNMEVISSQSTKLLQCEQILTFDSLTSEITEMLLYLGHHLSCSPNLFTKLCRIIRLRMDSINISTFDSSKYQIDFDSNEVHQNEALNIYRIVSLVLLPSLTRIDCNPAISALCWNVVSQFPFQTRFSMYGIWKGDGLAKQGMDIKPLEVVYSESKTLHGAKTCLKRLSKENTKVMGRQLAKYTHSCPLVVFNQILNQIEVYDNMIPFVVEALKYTTELARDVMAYCLVSQLRKDSNKLKAGDTHYSGWFSALSKFIGSFYKRYPTTELLGLLHYLLERMSTGSSLDLLVLKELLGRMGGCDTLLEVSTQQLEGLAGGRALQAEVMGAQVKDNVNKKAVRILREIMLSSGTALPLLLFIAQSRNTILYQNNSNTTSQLKLISYLYDTCQDVLMQFTDFLLSSGSINNGKSVESLVDVMPSMSYLLGDVGLAIPIAFQLVRPLVRAALHYGENPNSAPPNLQQWHPFSQDMKNVVCQYLPADVWCAISPELYLTFWSLSVYDVFLPKLKYEAEIKRLKEKYSELDKSGGQNEDRVANKQRRNDMTKILNLTNTLKEEQDNQRKHIELIKTMIINHKDSYLSHVTSEWSPKTTENIMQYCLYARVIMSPSDATFCSRFFMLLHSLETPGFSTIHFIDKTMKTLAPLIFCSTEYEAGFLGFYIHDLLEISNRWIVSKTAYNKEARSKCGMEKTFGAKGLEGRATHEDYINVCKIWHKKLSSILCSCLKSTEYMHVRAALVFLTKVAQEFPTRTSGGKVLLSCVESIDKDDNDKEDLKIMAKSLSAILKKRSSTWLDDEVKEKKRPITQTTTSNNNGNNNNNNNNNNNTNSNSNKKSSDDDIKSSNGNNNSNNSGGKNDSLNSKVLPLRNDSQGKLKSDTTSSTSKTLINQNDRLKDDSRDKSRESNHGDNLNSSTSSSTSNVDNRITGRIKRGREDEIKSQSNSNSTISSSPNTISSTSNINSSSNRDNRDINNNNNSSNNNNSGSSNSNSINSRQNQSSTTTGTSQDSKSRPSKPLLSNGTTTQKTTTSSNQDSESNSVKRPRQSGPSDRGINDVKPQSSGNSLTQVGNDSKVTSQTSTSTSSTNQNISKKLGSTEVSQTSQSNNNISSSVINTSQSSSSSRPLTDFEKREQRFGNRDGQSTSRGSSSSQSRGTNYDGGYNNSTSTSQQQQLSSRGGNSNDNFKDTNDSRRDSNKGTRRG